MEVFLKRAETPFKESIGEEKAHTIFEELKKSLYLIPGEFSSSLGSEIPKSLFQLSQSIEELPSENLEGILNHYLIFTNSVKDLANQNLKQINQNLIVRSQSSLRNLTELLNKFIEKARNGDILKESGGFSDIVSFTIGESIQIAKFDEFELFIKKPADNFAQKIGDDKAKEFARQVNENLKNIVE
jgi:hypothetical protein